MAVKIVRQPNKIALIGVPSSAAAHYPGVERTPAALRAAGLIERLKEAGYEVTDHGDIPQQMFQADDERPRIRNLEAVVASLNALRPVAEVAVKSGALLLVLGGDDAMCIATIAGIRRYYKAASLVWLDRDADLNIPATSPSGRIDGMVLAHITGRGAPELVRFWGEPPLVRDPEIAIFGVERLDPPEEQVLERSPIRRYSASDVLRKGPAATAQAALDRIHAATNQVVVHFDVDVIACEDFVAVNFPGEGGLRLGDVREALEVFTRTKNLAALEISEYNPEKDPEGTAARTLVDLIVSVLAARLAASQAAPAAEAAPAKEEKPETAKEAEAPKEAEVAPSAAEPAAAEEAAPEPAVEAGPAAETEAEAAPPDSSTETESPATPEEPAG